MPMKISCPRWGLLLLLLFAAGCRSPYYADQGALLGGLAGAGVGWAVGDAVGNEAAGALIGAGVGAVSGAAVGTGLDDIEARNRAQIAAQMGRQIPSGAVTMNDVIAMSQAGVNDDLIINHIRANGLAQPLQTGDLISLQQQAVSPRVIQAMQAPPSLPAGPPVVIHEAAPPPVIIEEYYYPPPRYHHHRHHRPHRSGWGFSYHGH